MNEIETAYKMLGGNPGKISFGNPRHQWKNNEEE
jgi:hypothetical protein